MRQLLVFFIVSIWLTQACKKNSSITETLTGTYIGTFQRQNAFGGQISNVSISFSDGKWTGQSQFNKYPALCQGAYRTSDLNIIFENTCPWTAEFDWTLILSGAYKIRVLGNDIELSKDYNAGYRDIYKLTKQ